MSMRRGRRGRRWSVGAIAMAIVLGQHVRVGNEDNLWGADRKRKTTVPVWFSPADHATMYR